MTLIERIETAAILEFAEKGVWFTMDDLCKRLGISKKTLYTQVREKEELLARLVEGAWASIKAQEAAIVADSSLDPVEKFRRVVSIMPAFSATVDYRKVRELEQEYPAIRQSIEARLEADWDVTFGLYETAVSQGLLRRVDHDLLPGRLSAAYGPFLRVGPGRGDGPAAGWFAGEVRRRGAIGRFRRLALPNPGARHRFRWQNSGKP